MGGARASGILDFHRVSPLSPLAVTLGFFFGAPIREYTMAALTLPFVLACAAKDAPSVWPAIQVEIAVLLGCWLLHSLALLTALASKKPKAGAKGTVGIVIFLLMFAGPSGFMGLASVASAVGDSPTLSFYGIPLPWLASVLLYAVPLLFFFMLASVRKMQSDRAHAYSKPEAVACLAVEALIVLGGLWGVRDFAYLPLAVIYSTAGLALVLILTITPNLGEFAKGVRRAERDGRTHVGYWSDLAPNRVAVFTLGAIVLLASTAAWYFIASGPFPPAWGSESPGGERAPSYSVPIAVAVLAVATFGLALQFFLLVAPRRGATYLGLFVFLAWLLPPVIGSILAAAQVGRQLAMAIVAISPIAGISMATDLGPMSETGTDLLKLAAVLPALVFALLFNNAVTWARRREVAAIHGGPALAKPEAEPDPLAV